MTNSHNEVGEKLWHRMSVKSESHSNNNSVEMQSSSQVNPFQKDLDILQRNDVKFVVKKGTNIKEENKTDSKREKEKKEVSNIIKKYWNEHKRAPLTDVHFYKIGKMLGKGAFGKVNLGIHKLSGKFVAVKSISKQVMTDESSKSKVMREVSIWEKLRHPSIIQLYETFESEKYILLLVK